MNQLERVGASGSYINRREVTKRFRVPPGHYIIIPSTYDSDKAGKFLLRMFTEKQADQALVSSVDDRSFRMNPFCSSLALGNSIKTRKSW